MKSSGLTLCLLILISCSVSVAEPIQKWNIVSDDNFPPYAFKDEAGKNTGLDTELIQAVMDYLKVDYKIELYPWKRVLHLLDKREADCAYQFVGSEKRFESYLLIGPLRTGTTLFAVTDNSPITDYQSLNDLKPYKIGTIMGYSYSTEFDSASFLQKDDGAQNYEELVKKLIHKRIDLIIGDLFSITYAAKKTGMYHQIRFLPRIEKEVNRYVGFNQQQAEKAGRFAHGLNAIKENGVHTQILQKWR